jgi:hypothetical protein
MISTISRILQAGLGDIHDYMIRGREVDHFLVNMPNKDKGWLESCRDAHSLRRSVLQFSIKV